MQLNAIQLSNFQCHADTHLSALPPVTVFVGPNGAGKSALFEGIRTLSRILTGPVSQAFGPPPYSFDDKVFRGSTRKEMAFAAVFTEPQFPAEVTYAIKLGYSGAENIGAPPSILSEQVKIGDSVVFDRAARRLAIDGMRIEEVTPGISLLATIRASTKERPFRGPQVLGSLARRVGSIVRYRLEPRQLSLPSTEPDLGNPVRMGYEGDNLAACLYWMRDNSPDRLSKIVEDVKRVLPRFAGITFNYVGADRVGFSLQFDDARRTVLAPNASSGTLLLLGLVTLLNGPTQPDIACMEEPETGLTPDAVRLFFKLLGDAAARPDDALRSQFMFSSHSPFVLVDAWNDRAPDRSFIKRLRIHDGRSVVEDVEALVSKGDMMQLRKTKDGRSELGLKNAEDLMCGRYLPPA